MAGHGYVRTDASVERWNRMREDVYKHFRFTSKASWISLTGLLFIPAGMVWFSAQQDLKWSFSGKRKGESLYRIAPPAAEPTED
ncbi:hypothetical protein HETIRDRAFT_379576 [Heterobasidion irregulare TC 32-1]|uniref:Complex I-B15 n=1 Tax=Heterobasidion irregulare (strain TC 32-1) TaxID=747525 RepID=W4KIM4_HETIT|nr:uncharacterized protein HETIRDRAFT_379576 [Heterobasidion irregulare TC 32-1]ETW85559.1 hypothetical protein HETIRDRAFT_379576 [Heterobasidion irregulare TC 32-1]